MSFGTQYAEIGYSAYHLLHAPAYTPQSPIDAHGTLTNILNPPLDTNTTTSLLPGRRPTQRPNDPTFPSKAPRRPRHSALDHLLASESAIASKKTNIARFGATWIRPPGISRTKQAMDDEEVEAREQEALAAREERMAEERQAQEDAERAAGARGGVGMDGVGAEGEEEGERDLDDEIPDADAGPSEEEEEDDDDYEDDDEDEEDDGVDAAVEGDTAASLPDMDVRMSSERDLDDSVPEAGEYEHTDTELESSSDVEDSRMSGPLQPVVLLPPGGLDGHRSPLAGASSRFSGSPASLGLDSSALLSSPGAARGVRRGTGRG